MYTKTNYMKNKKPEIVIEGIEGHIVLLCKGHYKYKDFLEAIRILWAVRCGYEYEFNKDGEADVFIANEMFKIFRTLNPQKADEYYKFLHNALIDRINSGLKPIEMCILFYRSEISMTKVKERDNNTGKYYSIVKLPKPKKRIFNRILSGDYVYDDYKLIN